MATKKKAASVKKVTGGVQKSAIIAPVNWMALLVISVMLTIIALVVFSSGINMTANYIMLKTGNLVFGFILMALAGISWVFFIKNLITEAHVKALEIFHGTPRKITETGMA